MFVCSGGRLVLTVNKQALIERNHVEVLEEEELVYNAMLHSMSQPSHTDGQVVAQSAPAGGQSSHQLRIVGCGYPDRGEGVVVVIASTLDNVEEPGKQTIIKALADLEVGEVWVDSPSKAQGYWELPQLSEHDFQATLEDERYANRKFLRTGDMGFMYKGELFICGRSKDMIIIGGSNHYPQDLERTVEQGLSNYIRAGCSAAIALSTSQIMESAKTSKGGRIHNLTTRDGGEVVVFVAELKDGINANEYDRIAQQCVALISAEHGVSLKFVFFIPSRTIPKTTSGKIARNWVRRALLANTLKLLYEYDNANSQAGTMVATDGQESGGSAFGEQKAASGPAAQGTHKGYESVPQQDANASIVPMGIETLPLETVRGMEHPQLVFRLQNALKVVLGTAGGDHAPAKYIDEHQALVALGVDSMSIVQFKGVLENR